MSIKPISIMQAVPHELLKEILNQTDLQSVLKTRRVCKELYQKIGLDLVWSRYIAGKPFKTDAQWLKEAVDSDKVGFVRTAIHGLKHVDVNTKVHTDNSLLFWVIRCGTPADAAILLNQGSKVDEATCCRRTAPLHFAAILNRVDMAQFLLDKGADINANDLEEYTPLHYAVSVSLAMTRLFIQKGAVINCKNTNGVTPLFFAAKNFQDGAAIIGKLCQHGADVHAKTTNGKTALHMAIGNNLANARTLLEWGANANAQSDEGYSPLHELIQDYAPLIENTRRI